MAKQSGLGDLFFIGGYDLSGDVGALTRIGNPSAVLDVTAIDKSAMERIYGLYDGEISFNAFFNDANDQEHEALSAKGAGVNRVATWFHGSGIGNAAAGINGKQINYDWTRGADGSLVATVQVLGDGGGLDFGEQLTAGKITHSSASSTTSLDGLAASSLGIAAYLQVFSLASGSPTVKIEHSTAAASGFADVTGGSFGVVAAQTSYRLVTALDLSVNRYLRVTTTGTFSNLVFAVLATRFPYS